jgi:hypothetical protein
VFDQSPPRPEIPAQIAAQIPQGAYLEMGGVVPGFRDALLQMQKGGHYTVTIPAELAYGANPPAGSPIPANADLTFDITLHDFMTQEQLAERAAQINAIMAEAQGEGGEGGAPAAAAAAAAADWVYVASGGNETDHYVDRTSIRQVGAYKQAWEKAEYIDRSSEYERMLGLYEYDCAGRRTRRLQLTTYYRDGRNVGDQGDRVWVYVTPDTVAENQLDYVCFGTLPK